MKQTLVIALSALLFIANAKGAATAADADEMAIYQAIFSGRQVVAMVKPGLKVHPDEAPAVSAKELARYNDFLREQLPGAEDETIAAYLRSRLAPAPLTPESNIGAKLVFVGQKDLDQIFRHGKLIKATQRGYRTLWDGGTNAEWAVFRKRFSTDGLISVSRVAFNKNKTQAMVFVWENWEGTTYVLAKINDKWVIQDRVLEVQYSP